MIHDQQTHALHLGRSGEPQNCLAVSERSDALIYPALGGHLVALAGHLQRPLVALRIRVLALLHFDDDLAGVLRKCRQRQQ
jgi:hypothetical protein